MHQRRTRRVQAGLVAAIVMAAVAVAGCGDRSASGDAKPVKIGFVASLSGTYQAAGEDMRDGFQLYLDTHGGQFGSRKVELVVADEGDGPATALPAATRLVKQDRVAAMAGIVAGGSYLAISALTIENKIPL